MPTFIDVREPNEFAMGHLRGAINIPLSQFEQSNRLDSIPKDDEIVLYCRTGSRSSYAMMILRLKGFKNVVNGINQDYVEARYLG